MKQRCRQGGVGVNSEYITVMNVMRIILLIVCVITIIKPNFGLSPAHRNNPEKMRAIRLLSIVVAAGLTVSFAAGLILSQMT